MSCAPHVLREAEAHPPGTSESITIISGQLEVGTEGNTALLAAGESHTFAADQPHTYRAGTTWATLLVTIVYAKKGEPS